MRLGAIDLTQKLVPLNIITTNNRLQRMTPFFLKPYHMAEGAATRNIPAAQSIESKLEADAEKNDKPSHDRPKEIPPPPEKPDPGDCCGSGCVRCVWDVYYEELEEYNKLYKQDPNPKS